MTAERAGMQETKMPKALNHDGGAEMPAALDSGGDVEMSAALNPDGDAEMPKASDSDGDDDRVLLKADHVKVYFKGKNKKSGAVKAVDDVSFEIMRGETFGVDVYKRQALPIIGPPAMIFFGADLYPPQKAARS